MRRNSGIQNAGIVSVAMDIRTDVRAVKPTEESAVAPALRGICNLPLQEMEDMATTIVPRMVLRVAKPFVNSFSRQEDADLEKDAALGMCKTDARAESPVVDYVIIVFRSTRR